MQEAIISRDNLTKGFSNFLRDINIKNTKVISPIFMDIKKILKEMLLNIIRYQANDIAICHGKNHNITQFLINDIVKLMDKEINAKTIYINSHIHIGDENIQLKIYEDLGIKPKKFGLAQLEKLFSDLSLKDNLKKPSIYIILFENIEILFQKQKQNIFYSLLELVNKTKNILFLGTTKYYNIMELMEKRIRSRFMQRSIEMCTPNLDQILAAVELIAKEKHDKKQLKVVKNSQCGIELFFNILVENKCFLKFFKRYHEIGHNVTDILSRLRLFFSNFHFQLINFNKLFIEKDKIHELIDSLINEMNIETMGLNNIENLSKFTTITLAALVKCSKKCIEKITSNLIYNEYIDFLEGSTIKPSDIMLLKLNLKELADLGLIHVRNEQKFSYIYELKYPCDELLQILKMEKYSKDKNLSLWLYDKKEK